MSEFDAAESESRQNEAVVAYLESLEAGRPADRDSFPELAQFFADTDEVGRLTAPLRESARLVKAAMSDPDNTAAYEPARAPKLMPSFEDYEIIEELGHGGMGVVYKARHDRLKRMVALKMILAGDHAGTEQTARFLGEARAVARLQHPNIVQIHEIGEHDGRPYFSLEYVDGGNLAARLRASPPSDMEAARLVELLARTVHYAHGRDIVHRDLKPANILLTSDDVPKIADFGLAKFLSEDSGATNTGTILGTASYMAPETAAGRSSEVGPAIDIYALGAILYELLTGRPPFRGDTMLETLRLVQEQSPEPPHVHNPRVDRALEAICLKCLEKTPTDRYPTAEALAEDLERFRVGVPVHAISGTARRWFGEILRESRYTEFMTLWNRATMGNAVAFFIFRFAWFLLLANGVENYTPYYAIMVAWAASDFGIVWFFRIRGGRPLWHFEQQILFVKFFFWPVALFTMCQFHSAGGSIAGLMPILDIEVAFAYSCSTLMLGGSFYPTAIMFGGAAVLQSFWPVAGALISAIGCAGARFWAGWKYRP
jgi:serine/threonine-protein kinase